jgi:tetratricopeptide (TPR) repeat protein
VFSETGLSIWTNCDSASTPYFAKTRDCSFRKRSASGESASEIAALTLYAGLADVYNISIIISTLSPKEGSPRARAAATKALELDPSLASADAALSMEMSHYEFDFSAARAEFQKAIQLNPNSAYAHLSYSGGYLMPMGWRAEAIAEMKKVVELHPQ